MVHGRHDLGTPQKFNDLSSITMFIKLAGTTIWVVNYLFPPAYPFLFFLVDFPTRRVHISSRIDLIDQHAFGPVRKFDDTSSPDDSSLSAHWAYIECCYRRSSALLLAK